MAYSLGRTVRSCYKSGAMGHASGNKELACVAVTGDLHQSPVAQSEGEKDDGTTIAHA
jgi:hypothetical protein